jgi:ferredoxin
MPSNWVSYINDHAAMWLIRVIPKKVNRILDDLLTGKTRRTKFKMGLIRSYITKMEKNNTNLFAHKLIIDSTCTGCGLCSGHCPVNNIEIKDRKPVFNDRCIMCFRCIYDCPSNAIKSNNFMVLKNGYSLSEVEKRMQGVELEPIEKCCKGILWIAVKNYLLDKD